MVQLVILIIGSTTQRWNVSCAGDPSFVAFFVYARLAMGTLSKRFQLLRCYKILVPKSMVFAAFTLLSAHNSKQASDLSISSPEAWPFV